MLVYVSLQAYLRYIVEPAASELRPLSEPPKNLVSAQRHALLASWACRLELPECQKKALDLLQQWVTAADAVDNGAQLDVSADADINPYHNSSLLILLPKRK